MNNILSFNINCPIQFGLCYRLLIWPRPRSWVAPHQDLEWNRNRMSASKCPRPSQLFRSVACSERAKTLTQREQRLWHGESKDFDTERAKTSTRREQRLRHGERKVECQCQICLNADSSAKCRHQTLNILVTLAHQCWEHHVYDQYHPEL